MKEQQKYAYEHPLTNAYGHLQREFIRETRVGPHLLAVALSVNR